MRRHGGEIDGADDFNGVGSYYDTDLTVIPAEASFTISAWIKADARAGDVDGDRDIDIFDIVRMSSVYGIFQPNPLYDPNSDWDEDGDIDIFDIVTAAGHYGESW